MVIAVCDVDVSRSIYGHRRGSIESCGGCGPIVPQKTLLTDTGNRADGPTAYHANHVVLGIGNVYAAIVIHGHTSRPVERGAGGRSTVAGKSSRAVAGERRDGPIKNHADAMVSAVCDIDFPGR